MLLTLVLASTLLQAPQPRQGSIESDLVEAIDRNYLYAEMDPWKQLRTRLLRAHKQQSQRWIDSYCPFTTEIFASSLRSR